MNAQGLCICIKIVWLYSDYPKTCQLEIYFKKSLVWFFRSSAEAIVEINIASVLKPTKLSIGIPSLKALISM